MSHPMLFDFFTNSLDPPTPLPPISFPPLKRGWQGATLPASAIGRANDSRSDGIDPHLLQVPSSETLKPKIPTETSFFRDVDVFEALRQTVFPELLRRRGNQRKLNLWSAACSSGQEPYSLALLLQAYFPLLTDWHLKLFASDRSEEMLARSRAGCYSQTEVERRLPPQLLKRYFRQQGDFWYIADEIRLMVEFRQIDLLEKWPPLPKMDVILMRNVLIYFERSRRRSILKKVRQLLKPDGYLFLGATETPFCLDGGFVPVQIGKAIGYKLCRE